MKKLTFTLIGFLVLFFACQKDDLRNDVPGQPHSRVKLKNQEIRLVPGFGLKSTQATSGFIYTLVAEVDAPIIDGRTVQATHVEIVGNRALVSYNMRGPDQMGAIDVIDITNPAAPFIIHSIEFPNRDVNTIGWHDGQIVVAGQDSQGAYYGFLDPEAEEIELEVFRLQSFSAMSMTVAADLIYVVSGSTGGLTIIDAEGNEDFLPFTDARSFALGQDAYVLTSENIYVLDGETIALDPDFLQRGSKADLAASPDFLFAALNRGGVHIYNADDLSLLQTFDRPVTPPGSDEEDYVTNSVSFNHPLLFIGNGGAGIAVAGLEGNSDNSDVTFVEYGYFDFGGPLSTNFVKSEGNFIFVATGLGGLKILTFFQDDDDDCNWTAETAFAGSDAGGGDAWWYYYNNTSSTGSTHPIYAGQQLVEGAFAEYSNGVLTITLGDNMMLRNVSDPVKIQGYNEGELPSERPAAGLFATYKGNELVIELPYFPYYVIHLDVWVCN